MSAKVQHTIHIDKIADISYRGARRATVFLGLGVNAARDTDFHSYQLNHLSLHQSIPQNLPSEKVEDFKNHFEDWIVRNALREVIESFDVFLENLLHACVSICAIKGQITEKESSGWKKDSEKGGVDEKLKLLRKRFNICTPKEDYFGAIKQARHCVTHRRSIVGAKDVKDDGELHLKWWRLRLFIKLESGKEIEMAPPFAEGGIKLEEPGTVCIQFVDSERIFKLGDPISFRPEDILEICELVKMATSELVQSFINYARDQGLTHTEKTI